MSHKIGDILSGKYALEASIGRGGMGEVFSASHLGSGRKVAVKVVNRAILGDMLMVRFYREAVAAGRIKSDFVPQMLDVDRTADGELFLVMELLRGESLSERLKKRGGNLTWDEVRLVGEDVLRGLIDAHAAGVIHRDLKPGNIFIEQSPASGARERGKVLDFGVCKLDVQGVEEHLTTTGEALGTVSYMAPEQIRGASEVDERADIYSFAVVIFETLSGRLPYDASGAMATIACKLEKTAKNLKECARVPIPTGLDALIARALARTPADRTSSVQEVLKAWRALGAATEAPRPSASAGALVGPFHTETAMTSGPATRAAARTSRIGIAVAVLALCASSILLVFLLFVRRAPAAEAPPVAPGPAAAATPIDPDPALASATFSRLTSADLSDTPSAMDAGGAPRASARAARPAPKFSPAPPAPRKTSSTPRIIGEPRY